MGQNFQQTLSAPGGFAAGAHSATQYPLELRDGALYLPPVGVDTLRETSAHLAPISPPGRSRAATPRVKCNDRAADSELLSAEAVVMLAIVGGISQQAVEGNVLGRQDHGWGELRGVVAGTSIDHGAREQMGAGVATQSQLGPAAAAEGPVTLPLDVVRAGMSALQAGRVECPFGTLIDQAEGVGPLENRPEHRLKSPFFSSRFSA